MILTGRTKHSEKPGRLATLSIKNIIWPDLGSNGAIRGDRTEDQFILVVYENLVRTLQRTHPVSIVQAVGCCCSVKQLMFITNGIHKI
jgi:hypothetical protein